MTEEQKVRFWDRCMEYAENNIGSNMDLCNLTGLSKAEFETLRKDPKEFEKFITEVRHDFASATYEDSCFQDLFLQGEDCGLGLEGAKPCCKM